MKLKGSKQPPIVLHRKSLKSVADYIRKRERCRVMIDWTDEMLEIVKTDYQRISSKIIAERLASSTKQNVTKNAVISKARSFGLGKKRIIRR